ncbi:hypothetical protein [Arcicella rosea]|uniref:Glucosyl transferase GtrII n=1 Tax=Arcicella rosea TaxID=502909 RepID=A0A841EW63_9BACT|nr:hypothetical protein [Arcicella rosea]MBB6004550.1 hypothetical protein [Arcicella rosea]
MKTKLSNNFFGILLSITPIALYFYFLSKYAVNIPKWDDHALKAFLLEFHDGKGIFAKSLPFFKQHNEHRIAFDRIITLLVSEVHGHIEYRWLMWIGNLTLVGVIGIFFKIFQKNKLSFISFVPIPFIIFQLELWENTFWGMASLQNFGILLFVFALIYFVSINNQRSFLWSIFFAVLATYTSGNGMLAFPVCVCILALQKRWKDVTIFTLTALVLIILYFYHFHFPDNGVKELLSNNIQKLIVGFFCFNGAIADLFPLSSTRLQITAVSGILLTFFAFGLSFYWILNSSLFAKKEKTSSTEYFILGCFMFLIASSIVVSVTRINLGEMGLLTSRYKIYSVMMVVCIHIGLLLNLKQDKVKIFIYSTLLISIGFNILANFTCFDEMVNLRKQLLTLSANWDLETIQTNNKSQITFYQKPSTIFDNIKSKLSKDIKQLPAWEGYKNLKMEHTNNISIQNSNFERTEDIDDGAYLIIQSTSKTFLVPALQHSFSVRSFLKHGKYWAKGFDIDIDKIELTKGVNHLGIWIQEGKSSQQFYLNDSLVIQNSPVRVVNSNW